MFDDGIRSSPVLDCGFWLLESGGLGPGVSFIGAIFFGFLFSFLPFWRGKVGR